MDAKQFLAEFGHIANAPGGVGKLRELVLSLAFKGELCPPSDEASNTLLDDIERQRLDFNGETRKQRLTRQSNTTANSVGPYEIPKHWSWVSLSTVGHTWGQKKPDDAFVYIDVSSIDNKAGVLSQSLEVISPSAAPSRARKIVKRGTLIYSTVRPYLLNIAIIDRDFDLEPIASTAFAIVHPWQGISGRYLYFYLRSPIFVRYVESVQIGMAYPAISDEKFYSGVVPLPPTEEQSRIVAKVEELMALCDMLEAQQQARRKLQNNLRQSTLQAVASATSPHELQTTWTRLAENFGRLFHAPEDLIDLDQCIKQLALKGLLSVRAEGEMVNSEIAELTRVSTAAVPDVEMDWSIPNHWVWARCAWLGEARLGKMLDAAKNKGDFRPYLRNINVRWGKFDLSDVLQMRIEEHELSKVSVRKGDLVICEGGEPGRAAVWSDEEAFVIQKALHRFRCNEHALPEYILFCLEHDYFSGRLSRYFTGATIKHLTGRALAEYPIPLPPVNEQKRILVAANELMHSVATLKERLIASNRCAAALAAASVASLTGIGIEQEKEPMKAPQPELIAPLSLGAAPDIKAQAPLATILARHLGEMNAKDLWQRFGGEIDAFYAQLKTEVAHGWILEPAPAEMRKKQADAVSA